MSDMLKIFLTSSLTIFGGVLVFTTGQIISKFLIEPIHEQSKCIGEIADALIFYADIYGNPGCQMLGESEGKREETSKSLRQYASLLISKTHMIKLYSLLSMLSIVPRQKNILDASKELIRLSNSVYSSTCEFNMVSRNKIMKALNIKLEIK